MLNVLTAIQSFTSISHSNSSPPHGSLITSYICLHQALHRLLPPITATTFPYYSHSPMLFLSQLQNQTLTNFTSPALTPPTPLARLRRSSSQVQTLHVYEINERDRSSPAYLRLSRKPHNSLGDLVPFSNKVYHGNLQKRLGITAGLCILIQHVPEKKGDRYVAIYSFYFGDFGHISVQGDYLTYQETYLAVTGVLIFAGVSGQVKLTQIVFPFKPSTLYFPRGAAGGAAR